MLELSGRGALIIGARRLGQNLVHRLAQEGVNIAISYRSSKDQAERLSKTVENLVERTHLMQGDLSVEEDVKRMVDETKTELGDLSFVVNLASNFPRTPFETLDGEAWDNSILDAKGNYLLAVYAARCMVDNNGPTRGHIIFFSDWAARETPYRDYLPYLTSKSAIDFMTRAFAVELAHQGILVNAIAPGPTIRPTEIEETEWDLAIQQSTPLRRESSKQDIVELIVTMLKSETVTGETIRVDSGRHLAGPGAYG